MALGEFARRVGPARVPICMSEPHFKATPRDGQAVGLPVAAIPSEGATGCGIQDIEDYRSKDVSQAYLKKHTSQGASPFKRPPPQ